MQKSKSEDVAVGTGTHSSLAPRDSMLEMDSPVESPRTKPKEPVFCTGPRAAVVAIGFILVALLVGWNITLSIISKNQDTRLAQLQDQLNRIPAPVLEVVVGMGPPSPSLGLDGTIYIDSNSTAGVLYYKTTQWNQYSQTLYPSSMYTKRAAPLAPSPQWVIIGAGALFGGTDMSGLTTNATVRNVGGVSAPRIANSTIFVESLLPTVDPETSRPRITLGDIVFANGSNTQGVQIQADANAAETLLIGPFPTGSSPTTGVTVQVDGAIVAGVTQQFIVDSNGNVYAPAFATTGGFVSNASGTYMQGGFISNSSGTYIPNLTTAGGLMSNSSGIYAPSISTAGGFVSNASGTFIPNLTTAGGLVSNSSGTYIHGTIVGNVSAPTYTGNSGKGNLTACITDDCLQIGPTPQTSFANGTLFSPTLASGTLYAQKILLNGTDLQLFVTNSTGMVGAAVTERMCVALFGDNQGKSAYCLLGVQINDTADFIGLNSMQAGSVLTTMVYTAQVQASSSITSPTISGTSVVNAGTLSINSSPAITYSSGNYTFNGNLVADNVYTSGGLSAGTVTATGSASLQTVSIGGSLPMTYSTGTLSIPMPTSITGLLSTSVGLSISGSGTVTYAGGNFTLPGNLVADNVYTSGVLSGNSLVVATLTVTSSAALQTVSIGGSASMTYSAGTLTIPMSTSVTGLLSASTGLSLSGSGTVTYSGGNFTFLDNVVANNLYTTGALSAATVTATSSASLQTLSIGGSSAITYTNGSNTLTFGSNLATGSAGVTTNNIVVNGGTTLGADSSIKNVAYLQTSIINLGGTNYTYFGPGVGVGNVSALYSAQNGVNKFTKCDVASCANVTGTFASEDNSGNVVFAGTLTTTGLLMNGSSAITYTGAVFNFPAGITTPGTLSTTAGLSINGSPTITYAASTVSVPTALSTTGLLSTAYGISITGSPTITYTAGTTSFATNIQSNGLYITGSPLVTYTGVAYNFPDKMAVVALSINGSSYIGYSGSTVYFPMSISSTGSVTATTGLSIGGSSVVTYSASTFSVPASVSVTGQVSASTGLSIGGSAAITFAASTFSFTGSITATGTITGTTGLAVGTSGSITYSASTFNFPSSVGVTGQVSASTGVSIGGSAAITYAASTFSFTGSITATGTITGTTGLAVGASGAITFSASTFNFPSNVGVTGQVSASTGVSIGGSTAITYAASVFSFTGGITATGTITGTTGVAVGTSGAITYSTSTFNFPSSVGVTGQVSASTGVSIGGSSAITYSGGNFSVPGNIVTTGSNGVYTNTLSATTSVTTPQVSTTNIDLVTINGYTYQVVLDVTFTTPSSVVQTYTLPSTTQYLLVTMTGGGGNGWQYGAGGAAGAIFNYLVYVSNQFTISYFVGAGSTYGSGVNGTSSNFTYTTDNTIGTTIWLLTEGGGYGAYSNANPPGGMGGGVWINGMYIKGGWPGEKGFTCVGGSFIVTGTPGETWVGPSGAMAYGGAGGSATCDGADKSALPGTCANVATSAQLTGGVSCFGYTGPGAGGSYGSGGARGGANGLLRIQGLRR